MLSFSVLSLLPALVLLWATPEYGQLGPASTTMATRGRILYPDWCGWSTRASLRKVTVDKKKPQDTSSSDHTHAHAHTHHTRIGREKTGVSGVTGMHAIRVSSTSRRNRNTALDQGRTELRQKHFQLLALCNFPLQKRTYRVEVGGHTRPVSIQGAYVLRVKTECVHACWCRCGIKIAKIEARLLILEIFPPVPRML